MRPFPRGLSPARLIFAAALALFAPAFALAQTPTYSFKASVIIPAVVGQTYERQIISNQATAAFTVGGLSGTGATLAVEYSDDQGGSYSTIRTIGTAVAPGLSVLVADGSYTVNVAGHTRVRLRVLSAGAGGNLSISSNMSEAPKEVTLGGQMAPPQPAVQATDSSGTIATANAVNLIQALNPTRKGCMIANTSVTAAEVVIVTNGDATTTRWPLAVGAYWSCAVGGGTVLTNQVQVTSATAGATYAAGTQ